MKVSYGKSSSNFYDETSYLKRQLGASCPEWTGYVGAAQRGYSILLSMDRNDVDVAIELVHKSETPALDEIVHQFSTMDEGRRASCILRLLKLHSEMTAEEQAFELPAIP